MLDVSQQSFHVEPEPTAFLLPRASSSVNLIRSTTKNMKASQPDIRKGDRDADDQLVDSEISTAAGPEMAIEMDVLGATVRNMVQGSLLAADLSYQASLLRTIRAHSCSFDQWGGRGGSGQAGRPNIKGLVLGWLAGW